VGDEVDEIAELEAAHVPASVISADVAHDHGGATHTSTAHDAHDAHAADDAHGGEPHESSPVLTIPLMILAFFSITAGFLNMPWAIAKYEKFLEWVEPRVAFPALEHAPFSNFKAVLSVALVLASAAVTLWLYRNNFAFLRGLTRRNRVAKAGYTFLENKYYLDFLYENVIVAAIKGPIAKACYWINQNVIDGIVNGVGVAGRRIGNWTYKNVDQAVVDGAVNGAGFVAEESGSGLRTVQTGKVQQYGALLFAAAGIAALILVIVI
jgi:NADH-quinone oxidoreductase subunit L